MYYIAETTNGGRVRASAWTPTDADTLDRAALTAARAHPDKANWLHVGRDAGAGVEVLASRNPGQSVWHVAPVAWTTPMQPEAHRA